LIDYARNLIGEKGISVTALNHFLNCPSEFMVKSILKLPEAKAPLAEKGSAIHGAFDRVWRERKEVDGGYNITVKSIEKTIKDFVTSYFSDSLLSKNEKTIVLSDIINRAPVISRALNSHFQEKGKVFTETWSETIFKFGDKKIPIHGKLDVIIDNGKEVLVFDYKTREKMSLAEIKGETKSSNGNYFRQLVFYKILLENDARFANKEIIPSLVFVMPDDKGRCPIITLPITNDDVNKVRMEIQSLVEAVWGGRIMSSRCGEDGCEYCKLKV
jgi:DNA helicase-2/ATP-dependent DNA helicase PcrA